MARRRKHLNRKLLTALGLSGMAIVILGIFLANKYYFKDPWPYIEQARAYRAEAERQVNRGPLASSLETDPEKAFALIQQEMQEDWDTNWQKVADEYILAVNNSGRDENARIVAWTEMSEVYKQHRRYRAARTAWELILRVDANHYETKRSQAEFSYDYVQYSDAQSSSFWDQVSTYGEDLIRLQPDDPYGYGMKAHALLALVEIGASPDRERTWDEAEEHIKTCLQKDEKNVLAHWLQAALEIYRANATNDENAKEQAEEKAESYLRKAIELNPDDPQAYLNLYEKFLYRRYNQKRRGFGALANFVEYQEALRQLQEEIRETEQELDTCIRERFSQNGLFYIAKAQIMQQGVREVSENGPIIEALQKALECSDTEPRWYHTLAEQYRIRGEDSFGEREIEDLTAAYTYLRRGIYHSVYIVPEHEISGPKAGMHVSYRHRMMQQFVSVSTRLCRLSTDPSAKQAYLAQANKAYLYLRDQLGKDKAECKIALGEIAYASGNGTEALKEFYQADQMQKAAGRPNARLKRTLFHVLQDTGHSSMSVIYAAQMWRQGLQFGRNFVEYAEAVATFPDLFSLEQLLSTFDAYDEQLGTSYRYRDRIQVVKAQVLVRLNRRDEARAILDALPESSERLEYLRAESQATVTDRLGALSKFVEAHPEYVEAVRSLIGNYLRLGREDKRYYQAARERIEKLLETKTDQVLYLTQMQLLLSEEDPGQVLAARWEEIVEQSILTAKEGFDQKVSLGQLYHSKAIQAVVRNERDLANEYWGQAEEYFKAGAQMRPGNLVCIQGQFDIALQMHNQSQAKQIIEQLRQQKSPETSLYEGLLHVSQKEWEEAANQLQAYLSERPVSLVGHTALARAYQALGRWEDAMEEAQLAWAHDMTNVNTQRLLLALYHRRNQQTASKEGWENLDSRQIYEVITIIERIINTNPDDPDAVSLQVRYYPLAIRYQLKQLQASSQKTPEEKSQELEKIAARQKIVETICQTLIDKNPQDARRWLQKVQVNNQYYQAVWEPKEKQRALQQTEQIFKEALAANPTSTELVGSYAGYLRENGRSAEAEKILLEMIDKTTGADQHEVRIQLGQMYSLTSLTYPQAQAQFEQILQEDEYNRRATMLLAGLFTRQKKIEEAQQLYQKLRKHKNDPLVMRGEIHLLLTSGRLEEAEALAGQMEKEFPQQSEEHLIRGNLEIYKAHYPEAVKYVDQLLEKNPVKTVQVNALLLKSNALYFSRRYNESEETLNQLRNLLPESSNIGRMLLANVYWAKNEPRRAVQELETAWKLEPDSSEILTALLNRLKQLRDWLRLEQMYLELMRRHPQSEAIYFEAATAMKQQAGDQFRAKENLNAQVNYTKALSWMQTALKLSTQSGVQVRRISLAMMNLYVEVGNFYRAVNNAATARTHYQTSLNLANQLLGQYPDDPWILLAQAEAYYGLGRRQEALQHFEKSLQQVEDSPSQSALVLERATRVGTLDDILTWSKRKSVERPDWLILRLLLANVYLQKGQLANQIQEMETARTLTTNPEILSDIDQVLAVSYIKESRPDKAIQVYQRILESNPQNVGALNNLAYLLMDQPGREAEAVKLAEQAYTLSPNDADIMDTYAGTLIRQHTPESYQKAEGILLRAIQQKDREGVDISPGLYVHLGQALLGLGRAAEAGSQLDLAEERIRAGNVFEDVDVLKAKIREARAKLNQVR